MKLPKNYNKSMFFCHCTWLLSFFKNRIDGRVERVITWDSMGQILVAVDKTLDSEKLNGYNPVIETQRLFPSIPIKNGQVMDAWNNTIEISILPVLQAGFEVSIISPEPDGIMHTKDDLIRKEFIRR